MPEYVNASEGARRLGVSRQYMERLITRGDLPVKRPWPRTVLVNTDDLAAIKRGDRLTPSIGMRPLRAYLGEHDVNEDTNTEAVRTHVIGFLRQQRPDWGSDQLAKHADRLVSQVVGS